MKTVLLVLVILGFMGCMLEQEDKYIPIEYQGIYYNNDAEIVVTGYSVFVGNIKYKYTIYDNNIFICHPDYIDGYFPIYKN